MCFCMAPPLEVFGLAAPLVALALLPLQAQAQLLNPSLVLANNIGAHVLPHTPPFASAASPGSIRHVKPAQSGRRISCCCRCCMRRRRCRSLRTGQVRRRTRGRGGGGVVVGDRRGQLMKLGGLRGRGRGARGCLLGWQRWRWSLHGGGADVVARTAVAACGECEAGRLEVVAGGLWEGEGARGRGAVLVELDVDDLAHAVAPDAEAKLEGGPVLSEEGGNPLHRPPVVGE